MRLPGFLSDLGSLAEPVRVTTLYIGWFEGTGGLALSLADNGDENSFL